MAATGCCWLQHCVVADETVELLISNFSQTFKNFNVQFLVCESIRGERRVYHVRAISKLSHLGHVICRYEATSMKHLLVTFFADRRRLFLIAVILQLIMLYDFLEQSRGVFRGWPVLRDLLCNQFHQLSQRHVY